VITMQGAFDAHFCPCDPCAADVPRFASLAQLTRLTHLDLGDAGGVAALALQLPNLQSMALRLPDPKYSASAALPSTLPPPTLTWCFQKQATACACRMSLCWHGDVSWGCDVCLKPLEVVTRCQKA
jgi:hypothetical protein